MLEQLELYEMYIQNMMIIRIHINMSSGNCYFFQLVQEKKDAAAAAAVHQSAALVVEVAGLVGTMQEKPGPFPGTPESPTSEDSSNRSSRYLISPK